jgi:hypothetical protein
VYEQDEGIPGKASLHLLNLNTRDFGNVKYEGFPPDGVLTVTQGRVFGAASFAREIYHSLPALRAWSLRKDAALEPASDCASDRASDCALEPASDSASDCASEPASDALSDSPSNPASDHASDAGGASNVRGTNGANNTESNKNSNDFESSKKSNDYESNKNSTESNKNSNDYDNDSDNSNESGYPINNESPNSNDNNSEGNDNKSEVAPFHGCDNNSGGSDANKDANGSGSKDQNAISITISPLRPDDSNFDWQADSTKLITALKNFRIKGGDWGFRRFSDEKLARIKALMKSANLGK